AAVQQQVERGTHFGAASPLEVEWAELITSLVPSAEEVRFTASGTEAAMLSIRLARAATGRPYIVKFDQHFHGWSDSVSVDLDAAGQASAAAASAPSSNSSPDPSTTPAPSTPTRSARQPASPRCAW